MPTVDQRILIPTPPQIVWEFLSDLSKNAQWQEDCRDVSFLSSRHTGVGTRFRCAAGRGQDRVLEVTAWYEGLGYQYTYVDGSPFRESIGRIRLQEIPEGTVVQWTLTFEVSGLRMGMVRQVEKTMENSLKALFSQVTRSSKAQKHEPKSLMRDAPDAEARSQYKSRHPSVIDINAPQPDEYAPPAPEFDLDSFVFDEPIEQAFARPVIPEPPVAVDDTRPRPAVTVPSAEPAIDEPDFLDQAEPPVSELHARFAPPPDYHVDTQPVRTVEDAPPAAAPHDAGEDLDLFSREFDAPTTDEQIADTELDPPPAAPAERPSAPTTVSMAPVNLVPEDTGQVSIWDVFGVTPPSKTQEMRAVRLAEAQQQDNADTAPADSIAPNDTSAPAIVDTAPTIPDASTVSVESYDADDRVEAPDEAFDSYIDDDVPLWVSQGDAYVENVADDGDEAFDYFVDDDAFFDSARLAQVAQAYAREGMRRTHRRGLVRLRRPR